MRDDADSPPTFPCSFPIKAIGRAEGDFDALVAAIVRRHAPDLSEAAIRTRPSGKGTYVSVTVTIRATSRAQLDAIYTELGSHPAVVMAL
jgi:putative lipoic acid-binding regulatory protein